MLLIENKKGLKTYTIINKYLCECGLLNEKNVCNALIRLVTLYNRHELINDRVMERLFNCLRNGIYVTCNMYDEFKSLEDEKEVDRC